MHTLFAIALLYFFGIGLALLLSRDGDEDELWARSPVFGLGVCSWLVANLNFAGLPVGRGAGVAIVAGLVLNAVALLDAGRRRRLARALAVLPWREMAICAAAIGLFVLPWKLDHAFPAFGDAFYYSSSADFVRLHGYRTPAEPAHVFPWLSQMHELQVAHYRVAPQYFLATLAATTGSDTYVTFVPASATFLFASFASFWLLARRLIGTRIAAGLALALYSLNVMLVLYPVSLNFFSQAPGFAFSFLAMAAWFDLTQTDAPFKWKSLAPAAIGVAGMLAFYPEFLPFMTAAPLLFVVIVVISNWRARGRAAAAQLSATVSSAVLGVVLHPLAAATAVSGVLYQMRLRGTGTGLGGFTFLPVGPFFPGVPFSLVGPGGVSLLGRPLILGLSVALAAIGLYGIVCLSKRPRWFVSIAFVTITAAVVWFWGIQQYVYGGLKLISYGGFVIAIGIASGVAALLASASKAVRVATGLVCVAAACGWTLTAVEFVRTTYGMNFDESSKFSPAGVHVMDDYRRLAATAADVGPDTRTLIFVRPAKLELWLPYFFRGPAALYFKTSPYFRSIADRPTDPAGRFDYYITQSAGVAWRDPAALRYTSPTLTMSKAQPFAAWGFSGWHGDEVVGGRPVRWMEQDGEILIVTPEPATIELETRVYLAPDRQPKHLSMLLDGKLIGTQLLDQPEATIAIGPMAAHAGINRLTLRTAEPGGQFGADPRRLNLLVEMVHFREGPSGPTLEGLTADRWVTPDGVHARLPTNGETWTKLRLQGVCLPPALPQVIAITRGGVAMAPIRIDAPGRFDVTVALSGPIEKDVVRLDLRGSKSFVPKAAGMGDDTRRLSFQIEALELIR